LEFGCATVNGPVIFNKRKFEANDVYFRETGVQFDGPGFYKAIPAKVSGELLKNGNLLVIIYVEPDLKDYATFTFVWNQEVWFINVLEISVKNPSTTLQQFKQPLKITWLQFNYEVFINQK
jgi:hypothetical protein